MRNDWLMLMVFMSQLFVIASFLAEGVFNRIFLNVLGLVWALVAMFVVVKF